METTEELMLHDSETLKHINEVRANLWKLIQELDRRAQQHDASKFAEPERSIYAKALPKLGAVEYGTPAYKELVDESHVAINHHQSKNRHHPEFWAEGIEGMDLVDLMELISDWMAATKRNKNGYIHKSIDLNIPCYKITPQLAQILRNTVDRYF